MTILFNLTGHYPIGFMALSECSLATLILVVWMYYKDRFNAMLLVNEIHNREEEAKLLGEKHH